MNNTYINFHLYGLNVYLTYVYISTHRELGISKNYLRLTRELEEKHQFLTIFTRNTNNQIKTTKDSFSFEVQDSNLKVNRNGNELNTALMISNPQRREVKLHER
ncbi:hypothetical protein A3B45_00605 [Candidatus Daviesbacteria bacterium RIFCSPLOWO2_01_FULL_39_12]|uniref:Uncharacterized protein n=1 Tax=Candidatus Daviesbacteria bacterium RIFCSPLOWO2_01_FULL_39_12 TaxID=1797785 RepID=A0A1F5KNE0_9BACT|nr:MAG: hypothetical protein A3B45_00605 [Candidatus Daviesbacteria bacterium RIFCSPLOWO2_01_FULL_39_12]